MGSAHHMTTKVNCAIFVHYLGIVFRSGWFGFVRIGRPVSATQWVCQLKCCPSVWVVWSYARYFPWVTLCSHSVGTNVTPSYLVFSHTRPMDRRILEFIWETMAWPNSYPSTARPSYIILSTYAIPPMHAAGLVLH